MKAIFPDSKLLQPIPSQDQGVHPNFSGNVNNTTEDGIFPSFAPEKTSQTAPLLPMVNDTSDKGTFSLYVLGTVITFIVLLTVFFIYRKIKQK